MPWTAPEVTRPAMPGVADERTMLEAWLDCLLPISPRESRLFMVYSHPYSRNLMTWR